MGKIRVIWLQRARREYVNHLIYAQTEFGSKAFYHWVEEIRETEKSLADNPRRYPLIPQLRNRPLEYRGHIVMRNFKVIFSYEEEKQIVKIRTIWDMRIDPKKLIRRIT